MFYRMITEARDRWYASPDCTVGPVIEYIVQKGELRGPQIEAIKTYLFLKTGCENRSLAALFCCGAFNNLNLEEIPLPSDVRKYMESDPAAAALYEYACLENNRGEQVSPSLKEQLSRAPEQVNCRQFFRDAFYGVTYTEYLFSLPMGAGKTWLMAAFIYLELYFACNEPENPAFAHNFIIFAPSGLKSSVVPSLKTIQKFDPAWVLPEPAAGEIKRKIIFEVLDQSRTGRKSNKTRNPNVQKIASHQPLSDLFGLVAVTNAEKVILDRIQEKKGQMSILDDDMDERDRQANELRNLIGKLPALSVFIDEVHHAVKEEIKLRAVINRWADNCTLNSVVGFSGTPYLEKAEKIPAGQGLFVASPEITNVVYYYPLAQAVGSFLKKPAVKISDSPDSEVIIEEGVREFFDAYKDTVYENGLTAKLGIYCGSIEKCEELVYPLVLRILAEYDISADAVLKFHKGNRKYPRGTDSQMNFDTLDQTDSRIRVVLLVQIGKEGWDCRSLTGIILSQEGDCPRNMVLQTSCRCLRQVIKDSRETALIYLNEGNARKLNAQLLREQHISLKEFSNLDNFRPELKRYDRTEYLKLPELDYYQMQVHFKEYTREKTVDIGEKIRACAVREKYGNVVKTAELADMESVKTEVIYRERGTEPAVFLPWLSWIVKSSFGFVSMEQLREQDEALKQVFERITYTDEKGVRRFSSLYGRAEAEAEIRKAFCEEKDFTVEEELVYTQARLLKKEKCTEIIRTDRPGKYYPSQETAEKIVQDDMGKLALTAKEQEMLELARETGNTAIEEMILKKAVSHPGKDRSFHYLPYRMDSGFEITFLKEALTFPEMEKMGLEIYYNGDRSMTEFQIRCYRKEEGRQVYVGIYTPDFVILKRKTGRIYKVLLVETKGQLYAGVRDFQDRRRFMETEFTRKNNEKFGYERFAYLYLEDTLSESARIRLTQETIYGFFGEEETTCR